MSELILGDNMPVQDIVCNDSSVLCYYGDELVWSKPSALTWNKTTFDGNRFDICWVEAIGMYVSYFSRAIYRSADGISWNLVYEFTEYVSALNTRVTGNYNLWCITPTQGTDDYLTYWGSVDGATWVSLGSSGYNKEGSRPTLFGHTITNMGWSPTAFGIVYDSDGGTNFTPYNRWSDRVAPNIIKAFNRPNVGFSCVDDGENVDYYIFNGTTNGNMEEGGVYIGGKNGDHTVYTNYNYRLYKWETPGNTKEKYILQNMAYSPTLKKWMGCVVMHEIDDVTGEERTVTSSSKFIQGNKDITNVTIEPYTGQQAPFIYADYYDQFLGIKQIDDTELIIKTSRDGIHWGVLTTIPIVGYDGLRSIVCNSSNGDILIYTRYNLYKGTL